MFRFSIGLGGRHATAEESQKRSFRGLRRQRHFPKSAGKLASAGRNCGSQPPDACGVHVEQWNFAKWFRRNQIGFGAAGKGFYARNSNPNRTISNNSKSRERQLDARRSNRHRDAKGKEQLKADNHHWTHLRRNIGVSQIPPRPCRPLPAQAQFSVILPTKAPFLPK